MDKRIAVTASPYAKAGTTVTTIMRDVLIALAPAAIMAVRFFGMRAVLIVITSVIAAVLSEWLFVKIVRKRNTISDLSAVVTGLILALNMPPTIPLWMVAVGSIFAIIALKQIFGGLGRNLINPALGGRCFIMIVLPGIMAQFIGAGKFVAVSYAVQSIPPSMPDAFVGNAAGCVGETSALALIIGFIYMLVRKIVSIRIPLAYILTYAVLTYFFGLNSSGMSTTTFTLYQVLSGGLLLGAFFMATDYVTSPVTPNGKIIFGIGCGILTFLIGRFIGHSGSAAIAIVIMNLTTPLIEKITTPGQYGKI